jgi:hypothetical protein
MRASDVPVRQTPPGRWPNGTWQSVFLAALMTVTVLLATVAVLVGSAQARAAAEQTAAHLLAHRVLETVDTFGCATFPQSPVTCARALDGASSVGSVRLTGTERGHTFDVALASTTSAPCPRHSTVEDVPVTISRRVVVQTTSGGVEARHELTLPPAPTLLVPARPGQEVSVRAAGLTITHQAGPGGCAAFPGLPAGPVELPDGTTRTVGGTEGS